MSRSLTLVWIAGALLARVAPAQEAHQPAPLGPPLATPDTKDMLGHEIIQTPEEFMVIRGNHPRRTGLSSAFARRRTALRNNIVFSDVLYADSAWRDAAGHPTTQIPDIPDKAPSDPDQLSLAFNIHGELWNLAPNTSSIGLWSDSLAGVGESGAWGGIFTASSHNFSLEELERLRLHIPEEFEPATEEAFDVHLTGVEIDVLNFGKPGTPPNHNKTGLSIVGFHNTLSHAIGINSDPGVDDKGERNGHWLDAMYVRNSLDEREGRVIVADLPRAKIGLDFSRALFTDGAAQLRSEGVGTGVQFNRGRGGEIFSGARDGGERPEAQELSIRMGEDGLRVVTNDNQTNVLAVSPGGRVEIEGELVVNGRPIAAANDRDDTRTAILVAGGGVGGGVIGSLVTTLVLTRQAQRRPAFGALQRGG